jgi:phage terminase Nu1 subunit (DNA packaging protein)
MPIVSVSQFAEWYGWTQPYVSRLIAEGMPAGPPVAKGKSRLFDSAAAAEWVFTHREAKLRTPDEGETLNEANLRKARADADMAEVRASEAANELIPLAEAEALIERVMVLVASQLDGMAGRLAAPLAAETDAAACRQTIFDECRRIRGAMAAEFEARATVAEGEGRDTAAAAEVSGPVGGHEQDPSAG